jgi:hypothetical protein
MDAPLSIPSYEVDYDIDEAYGYINITKLCHDNDKEVYKWTSLEKTTQYVKLLCNTTSMTIDELFKIDEEDNIWTHPHIAINVAQWISHKCEMYLRHYLNSFL